MIDQDLVEKVDQEAEVVLRCIDQGEDDVHYITQSSTLTNSQVNWRFQKLEDLGLIEVKRPEGKVERVLDGTRKVFDAPKQARLTEKGERYVELMDEEELERYLDMSHAEAVDRIYTLESRVDTLEAELQMLREEFMREVIGEEET